jgi:catechol 2,3-dioxygenase-like lactoylglutathione lyase family enzyme
VDVTFGFDHAVVIVPRLPKAIDDYRRAGFTVVPGGRHEGSPTHNALIAFRDGSYLELLASTNPFVPLLLRILHTTPLWGRLLSRRSPIERRFLGHFGKGTGLVDFAPLASPIGSAVHAARERGLAIEGPFTMSRARPDGERLEWQVAIPLSNDLPFLIEDITLREKRVPYGEAAAHRIGVSGAAELTVSVRDLKEAGRRYEALLGRHPDASEGRLLTFIVGKTAVKVVGTDAARKDGPSNLALEVGGVAPPVPPGIYSAGIALREG